MKMALNGALTIGTLDGANIEIREAVGADNFFLFGLTAEQVLERKAQGYHPREIVEADPELRTVLTMLADGFFAPEQPRLFHPLVDGLLAEDRYLVLADFHAYAECQRDVDRAYLDPAEWARMSILNIARVGKFSSDRAIAVYARDIWRATAVPVNGEPVG